MKTIELLLYENVDNLGIVGDVVKVKPGYARNYLLPMGKAGAPAPGAIARLAARRAEVEAELKRQYAHKKEMIDKLAGFELTIKRAANEEGILYGGVSQHDIAAALQEEGFQVEDRHVRIGQQIKRLDTYAIPLVLEKDLATEIKLWVVSDAPIAELEDGATEAQPDDSDEPEVIAQLDE